MRPNVNWNIGVAPEKHSTYASKAVKAGIPFASQVTEPDTKYIIKYDFDLDDDFTMPDNCILEFEGGSLKGGTINLNNAYLSGGVNILSDVTGKIKNSEVEAEWFGILPDGNDVQPRLQMLLDLIPRSRPAGEEQDDCNICRIHIGQGTYYIGSSLHLKPLRPNELEEEITIVGDGSAKTIITGGEDYDILRVSCSKVNLKGLTLCNGRHGLFVGYGGEDEGGHPYTAISRLVVDDLCLRNNADTGMYIRYIVNLSVKNSYFYKNRNWGLKTDVYTILTVSNFENCSFRWNGEANGAHSGGGAQVLGTCVTFDSCWFEANARFGVLHSAYFSKGNSITYKNCWWEKNNISEDTSRVAFSVYLDGYAGTPASFTNNVVFESCMLGPALAGYAVGINRAKNIEFRNTNIGLGIVDYGVMPENGFGLNACVKDSATNNIYRSLKKNNTEILSDTSAWVLLEADSDRVTGSYIACISNPHIYIGGGGICEGIRFVNCPFFRDIDYSYNNYNRINNTAVNIVVRGVHKGKYYDNQVNEHTATSFMTVNSNSPAINVTPNPNAPLIVRKTNYVIANTSSGTNYTVILPDSTSPYITDGTLFVICKDQSTNQKVSFGVSNEGDVCDDAELLYGNDYVVYMLRKGVLATGSKNKWSVVNKGSFGRIGGATDEKPSPNVTPIGFCYFFTDGTNSGKPAWWNGTNWVNANGEIVI